MSPPWVTELSQGQEESSQINMATRLLVKYCLGGSRGQAWGEEDHRLQRPGQTPPGSPASQNNKVRGKWRPTGPEDLYVCSSFPRMTECLLQALPQVHPNTQKQDSVAGRWPL